MDEDIRIKDLPLVEDGIQSNDYIAVDNETDGTRKATIQDVMETDISGLSTEATNPKDAINEHEEDISSLHNDVDDINNDLTIEGTASGAIATFDDGSDLPMPSLKVAIEPQQDLHGYDSPWVGGAGKNKLQVTATTQTINGVTFTVNSDGTVSLSGTATETFVFPLISGTLSFTSDTIITGGYAEASASKVALRINGSNLVPSEGYTISANTNITEVAIGVNSGFNTNGVKLYPMIRLSSVTDATFAPYSNICPISGHTEANVTVADDITNKKYFDGLLNGTYGIVDLGTLMWSYDSTYKYFYTTQLVASLGSKMPSFNLFCGLYKCITMEESNQFSDVTKDLIMAVVFHGHNNALNIRNLAYTDAATFKTAMNGVYLVYELATPTTPTVTPSDLNALYEKFGISGTTTTIPFVDGQGQSVEVFGGTLDVVSGVLTVDRAIVDMGDLYWNYSSNIKIFTASVENIKSGVYTDTNLLSSIYPVKPMSYSQFDYGIRYNSATAIGVKNPLYTDATAFKTAMSGVQLVYELATPLTIQLSPTQVKSLLGQNNVWADTGDVDVIYFRNTNSTQAIRDIINTITAEDIAINTPDEMTATNVQEAIDEHTEMLTEQGEDISEIKQSLSDLADKKIIRKKLTLSSNSSGFAVTTFTISGYQILSASGKGFGCLPFDGGDGYWYIVFINVQTWAKHPNLSNKDIWITYQVL